MLAAENVCLSLEDKPFRKSINCQWKWVCTKMLDYVLNWLKPSSVLPFVACLQKLYFPAISPSHSTPVPTVFLAYMAQGSWTSHQDKGEELSAIESQGKVGSTWQFPYMKDIIKKMMSTIWFQIRSFISWAGILKSMNVKHFWLWFCIINIKFSSYYIIQTIHCDFESIFLRLSEFLFFFFLTHFSMKAGTFRD